MEKNKKDKERKKKRFSKAKYGDFIRRFYRLMPTAELAELLGVEPRQVSDFAYRNNCDGCLGKDKAVRKQIATENGRKGGRPKRKS